MNNRTPKRHVYLPGLSAFDSSHQKAAAYELFQGPNGPTANSHDAGSVFFDTVEAKRAAKLDFSRRAYDIRKRMARGGHSANAMAKMQRELSGMTHAVRNSHVIDNTAVNPGVPHADTQASDILFVKGHGNPNRDYSITSRTTGNSGDYTVQGGNLGFNADTDVSVSRGHKASHNAQSIAQKVKNINGMLESPGLDVRITSCGSAGGVSSTVDPISDNYRYYNSFAGSVSHALDDMHANREITVSCYIGESNSSHPRTPVSDGFVSQVKQKGDNATFQQRRQNFLNRVGAGNAVDSQRPKQVSSTDDNLIQQMEQVVSAPNQPPVSDALQCSMRAYTKVKTSDQMVSVVAVPRSSTRVQFPRR